MRLSLGLGPVAGYLWAALLLAAALPLASGSGWLGGVQSAAAQSAPSSSQERKAGAKRPVAKAKSKDATPDTDRLLDTAAKSLAEGNADAAMTALDGILAGGGLANKHMARALYLRGVAHRKKARPAQAIADLTSALWLKGGLGDADRTAALKERSEISREIGVADAGPPAPTAQAPATPAVQAPAAPVAQTPTAQTSLVRRPPPIGGPDITEGGFPRAVATAPPAAPADSPAAPQSAPVAQTPTAQTGLVRRPPPIGGPGVTEGGFPRVVATAPPAAPADSPAAPQPAPVAQTPTAQTSVVRRPPPIGGPGITEGGFPRVEATAPPAATPAETTPPAPRTQSSGDGAVRDGGKATSSWQRGTSVENRAAAEKPAGSPASGGGVGEFFSGLFGGAPASSPPAERAAKSSKGPAWSTSVRAPSARQVTEKPASKSAAVVTSSTPPPSKGAAPGDYRIQIAAMRNRKEAEAVVARIRKEHGRVIGSHKLEVDETVFGNMGTFYRVRMGPFAAVGDSKAVCDELRTKGFDCLVVTQ